VEGIQLYYTMVLIRRFEEALGRLFQQGHAPGTTHLSIGQEACAAGAMAALRPEDQIFSTHRGHGHFLAKGADPKRLMAEILGKAPGYCRGFGGSQHLSYPDIGCMGTNGITGGNFPVATGAALALQRLGPPGRVVVCFTGDGACNQGTFHESLNMAGLWKLPIVYFVENNLYAQWTHIRSSSAVESLAERARSYGMPGASVDGMDPLAVRGATEEAVEGAREGGGPRLLEAHTYRLTGHSRSDVNTRLYRPAEEEESWKARDPIPAFRRRLLDAGSATEEALGESEESAARLVEEAVAFALAAPSDEPSRARSHAYATSGAAV
jgi:pyruvate dehydrogenase E1 component alpha subunit